MKAARCALAGRRPTFMATCTRSVVVRCRLVRAWCAVVWFARGCNVELWSPGGSPVDWKESRKENLHVEGKLHLRCAEQVNWLVQKDKPTSTILVWKLVTSSGEMRARHVSLETPRC